LWLSSSRGVEQLLSLLITTILARLVTPAEYGLIGMATVVLIFLRRFADFGTGSAIIQRCELGDTQLSSIFWFNALLGTALGGLLFVVAPLIARFYDEPGVQPVVAVLALTLPLQSLAIVPDHLLRRRLQFSRWVVRGLAAVAVGGGVGIALALAGGGVWALVGQQLAQAVAAMVALWLAVKWRPLFSFRFEDIREIGGFTSGVVGFNLLNYFVRNTDFLLIGRFLGPVSLGLYALAYRLMRYPAQTLSGVASQTLFPVFSRMGDEQSRISNAYIRVVRYITVITFPIMVGMALTAEDFLVTLFGPQWLSAAPLLVYLALAVLLQPAASLLTAVIWAKGYTQWHLKYAVVQSGLVIAGFAIGLQWGVEGVAASYLITSLISSTIAIVLMFPKCGVSRTAFLKALGAPATGVVAMTVAIFLVRFGLESLGQTPQSALGRLVVDVLIGALAYIAVTLLASSDLRQELHQSFGHARSQVICRLSILNRS
jgi:PST family polysaccharide transporter